VNRTRFNIDRFWLVCAVVGVTIGGILWVAGAHDAGNVVWAVTTLVGAIPLVQDITRSLVRREFGVDWIALLAIIGCLGLDQYLAGAVIVLMLSSGQTLESYADRRAHRELSDLLERAPQQVNRYEEGELHTRPIDEVRLADRLFVKTGEVVAVDGVLEGDAVLDESALTGESRPVERPRGALCARAR
jgi:cation transport ATPase